MRQALFRRGKALLALGDGDRAEKDLKKVLEARFPCDLSTKKAVFQVNPGNLEAKQALQQALESSIR